MLLHIAVLGFNISDITQLDMAAPCDNDYLEILFNVKIGNYHLNDELAYILYKVQGRFEIVKII